MITAIAMPTIAAVRTTQSTVTAPDSSFANFVNNFIMCPFQGYGLNELALNEPVLEWQLSLTTPDTQS